MMEIKLILLFGRRGAPFIGSSEELAFLDPTQQIRPWPNYSFWISPSCPVWISQVSITSTAFHFGVFSVLRRVEIGWGRIPLEMIPALIIREQPAWGYSARKDKGDSRAGRGRYLVKKGYSPTVPQHRSDDSNWLRPQSSDQQTCLLTRQVQSQARTLGQVAQHSIHTLDVRQDWGRQSDIIRSSQATGWACAWTESQDEAGHGTWSL